MNRFFEADGETFPGKHRVQLAKEKYLIRRNSLKKLLFPRKKYISDLELYNVVGKV